MNKSTTRSQTKQEPRRDRREGQRRREAEQQTRAVRKRRILIGVLSAVIVLAVVAGVYVLGQLPQNQPTSANANPAYASVNGIPCDSTEQLTYHVHAHLTLYINGQQVQVPQQVGIASDNSCIYWLHTHDTSGVIHIEAPSQQTFSLGTFFQIWSSRFPQLQYPTQLDQTAGWQAYVNGKPYMGDFHSIPLAPHALITLAYNSPGITPDTTYAWQGL